MAPGGSRACLSAGVPTRGPSAPSGAAEAEPPEAPDWEAVESLLATLAATRAFFPTATARSTWISSYEPGRRLRLESDSRSSWVQVEHLRECWRTFERLGRIRRSDVLEPGRCSALVMALFARVPGVRSEPGEGMCLLLPGRRPAADRPASRRLGV
jgi:hypothetical protein